MSARAHFFFYLTIQCYAFSVKSTSSQQLVSAKNIILCKDLALKKEKKIFFVKLNQQHMAEVFLHNKSYVFTLVVSTPNTKIKHRGTMNGQKILSCVVIKTMLQQLRTKLFYEGFALGKLLEAEYLGADAVLFAVEKSSFCWKTILWISAVNGLPPMLW